MKLARGCRTLCGFQRVRSSLLFVLPEYFSVNKIQTNQSFFSHFITTPTTPRPVLRVFHQSSYHRIRMHVVQLLFYFPTAPNVEIIKPSLPKPLLSVLLRKRKPQLTPHAPPLCSHRSRHSLLQYLDHLRRRTLGRFAQQEMHVLRHQHISDKLEPVPLSHFPKNLHKKIFGADGPQQRPPFVTTECDEVQIPSPVVPFQFVLHRGNPAHPLNTTKGAAPPLSLLHGNLPQWYTPSVPNRSMNSERKHGPPAQCMS